MSEYIPVPVSDAAEISRQRQKNIVVILSWDRLHDLLHTTTYGVRAVDKELAAALGEICSEAAGARLEQMKVFEDFRDPSQAAVFKEQRDTLLIVIERYLKICADGVQKFSGGPYTPGFRAHSDQHGAAYDDLKEAVRIIKEQKW